MSSGIAAQRRTGAPVVGEVLMDFADGGTYSQKTLSESILEVEKIRKSFEAQKQAERVERASKEGELRAGDVDVLVKEFSLTPSQAKTCLIGSSGDLRAAVKSLFEGSVLPAGA
ncbi:hypothetical protein FFLO_01076 [Filobasidium floriforme]|uniref:Nascent polypeptide-associated complex subunit alpha-like UBA domain-containing protein n=1 Tax=Filobasidium floriforme TaxID=5210 RepID=A0A8K0JQ97_9TREE|nr:hypothetical protein FFLO_01076 [Filobasidium floriforme]